MRLLGWALFAAVVAVATARVILSRDRACYGRADYLGWTHDELDAAHTAALAQWRAEGIV